MLEITHIKKYFPVRQGFFGQERSFVKAVDGIDLQLKKGENLSLVGESGCGKTTLARIIMQLERPDEGNVILNGKEVFSLKGKSLKNFKKDVQMVFQDPYSSLDPRYSIKRVLDEAFVLFDKKLSASDKLEMMREMLHAVGLPDNILERYPHEFSGGERQRIAIARALLVKPKILILDEAVSSLDVLIQKQIIDLLKALQQKFDLTYLFISHNLRVVKAISQRIAVMYKGKVVELASAQEIFNNPLHPYTQQLLKAAFDYKVSEKEINIHLSPHLTLKESTPGHFILE